MALMTPVEYMNRSAGFVSFDEFKKLNDRHVKLDDETYAMLTVGMSEYQFAKAALMRDLFDQLDEDSSHREWIELNASK